MYLNFNYTLGYCEFMNEKHALCLFSSFTEDDYRAMVNVNSLYYTTNNLIRDKQNFLKPVIKLYIKIIYLFLH